MDDSPYHRDEIAAQALAGGGAPGAGIRSFMPEQHRAFFAALPYLFIGIPDTDGWPLATILTGEPGFVTTFDATILRIDALPSPEDPVSAALVAGREIGVIGIDFSTRRRNRANGRITAVDGGGVTVAVKQSFGNCPKYIQRRAVTEAGRVSGGRAEKFAALDAAARAMIARADTFFVASRSRATIDSHGGADISHRGGRPGFVRIDGDTLTIPDFSGNRYFNTLGNFLGEPRGALLFVDFKTGDVLQLQGTVEIDWMAGAAGAIEGAQRLWRLRVCRGWRRTGVLARRWDFIDYAPTTARTGVWAG